MTNLVKIKSDLGGNINYDVVLSHYRENNREEQIAIFNVACSRINREEVIYLLKKSYTENSAVLTHYASQVEAELFAEQLRTVGADIAVHSRTHKNAEVDKQFYQSMRQCQLSIGVAVLCISFVTKSIPLSVCSLLFIIYMLVIFKTD